MLLFKMECVGSFVNITRSILRDTVNLAVCSSGVLLFFFHYDNKCCGNRPKVK